jgi:hypothetical protein
MEIKAHEGKHNFTFNEKVHQLQRIRIIVAVPRPSNVSSFESMEYFI